MARKKKTEDLLVQKPLITTDVFVRPSRVVIPVPHRELDRTIQTEQDQHLLLRLNIQYL